MHVHVDLYMYMYMYICTFVCICSMYTMYMYLLVSVSYCIRYGGRALLADDMGLGKTLQALAVMSHYRGNWPLLIICPSSVRMTWSEVHNTFTCG